MNLVRVLMALLAYTAAACGLEPIVLGPEGDSFIGQHSKARFVPWGLNYGNAGRLIEDFWADEWATLAGDFAEMKELGANVVRVHLQFGKFMAGPAEPNAAALELLGKLLRLAEETGVYLDLTGLGSYRPSDVPAWYDALDEPQRWAAQARFWAAIAKTCAASPAVFCYDLMNEPVVPGERRGPGQWRSGQLLGGFDFVQFITLDPVGRDRAEIAAQWICAMTAKIRAHDSAHLITVGLLPWLPDWKHLSGFEPKKVAPELSFLSAHIYPKSAQPGEALESLRNMSVPGKAMVIEETFNLTCTVAELEQFIVASRELATGWMGHYDGTTIAEYDELEAAGKITLPQTIYRDFLRLFRRLKPTRE